MSLKRFCDLCEGPIPDGERFYNVILRVMSDPDHDEDPLDQEYADFCYGCVQSGKAVTQLLAWYEERAAATAAKERTTSV